MNKTAIKNFAIWARNKLIADISYRAGLMGITADGIQKALPQSAGMTEFYDIGTVEPYSISGEAVRQRRHLVDLIRAKERGTNYKTAYKYVLEEVAYTWFNRLIAVRFMEVNDYLPSHIRVLSSDSGKMEPDLVTTPFDADLSFTAAEEQEIYQLKQENKLDEVFRILFIKQCNALNEILPALFEMTNDYTELLLNLSVIDQDGVVYHLVHDIPEEDFDVERGGQVEIIGWLYQYYNTEPKNEAFAKKGKITKEEVPAVTQLFTPDWIVRYMVENSLGRLWVEGHPNEGLKAEWKYYLEEAEQESDVQAKLAEIREAYSKINPEDIKLIDPCMGSGHILAYAFDVLMQIYESAGYGQRDAAILILENNLYGLDIDDRAFQMAYFSIMMKARQYNRRILNGEYKPNLFAIQESNKIDRNQLQYFGASLNELEKNSAITQTIKLLDDFKDAKEYGSILTVESYDWNLLDRFVSGTEMIEQISMDMVGLDDTAKELDRLIKIGRRISFQYDITVTNPPYRSVSECSDKLREFAKGNYPDSKSDMSTMFMERTRKFTKDSGFIAMINIPVWMFISSYERLRKNYIETATYLNMLHLGRGVFGSDFGTTAFVVRNLKIANYRGTYYRLFNKTVEVVSVEKKEEWFFERKGKYFSNQDNYLAIPGNPIAYWITDSILDAFHGTKVSDMGSAKSGMTTTDNNRFLRLWEEVDYTNIGFSYTSIEETEDKRYKWYPFAKGGDYRKWFGNYDFVVNWFDNGKEIRKAAEGASGGRLVNIDMAFKECFTWSKISSGDIAFRVKPSGIFFSDAAPGVFCDIKNNLFLLGVLNSSYTQYILNILNPTINYVPGAIANIPIQISDNNRCLINDLVLKNIEISKADWDSFETSFNYVKNPLITDELLIENAFKKWTLITEQRFNTLKKNEICINRIVASEFSPNSQLTVDIEDKYISVRKANLHREICNLVSYAVGCLFGRYSIDVEGIAYAGGEWDKNKYKQFQPNADNVIPITDEEFLEDDIVSRFCTWLKIVYGEQTLEENLDFIAKALGNKGDSSREIIRNYFLNGFFKDHCQTYSVTGSGKRPIYWLFDSGKQNGFKALIYLHRYNADTIGNIRIDYLHRMQRIYESEINRMQDMIDHSNSSREVAQATKRREKLTKQLKECREYDEKLAHLALSRIELDLDDGVKKNYRKIQTAKDGKFYEVLADSKNIMSKE